LVGQVVGNGRTLLVVAADDAEHALEALLGQRRVGGGAGDHRHAGAVVDRRGGNRGAGIEVADNAGDLGVDQLLRHGVADLRIGLIVFGEQFELDLLAAEADPGGVGFVDREAGAVLVVLAQVRDAAGERGDAADLDHQRRAGVAGGGGGGGSSLPQPIRAIAAITESERVLWGTFMEMLRSGRGTREMINQPAEFLSYDPGLSMPPHGTNCRFGAGPAPKKKAGPAVAGPAFP
jgi:hypothetical protein